MHYIVSVIAIVIIAVISFVIPKNRINQPEKNYSIFKIQENKTPEIVIPDKYLINNNYHVFQTFNNCGPAALSMALSYYDINISQTELGNYLRPYQNAKGDNDDKSVTLSELAQKAEEFNLVSFHRPAGDIKLIEKFIANEMPVITRTLLKETEDIGHYRVIKGYDSINKTLTQDDSLQGNNLEYSYDEFLRLWKTYNYEYLVLVPKNKNDIAVSILGKDVDEQIAWNKAVDISKTEISNNPSDIYARFNLSVALYHTKQYKESIEEFEKVQNFLAFRTLWYQLEPILSYKELGNYTKVFEITDGIINNQNRAYSELYLLRGEIYQKQGDKIKAKHEYEKALLYNANYKPAQEGLDSLN